MQLKSVIGCLAALFLLLSPFAWAQNEASIGGTVKDNSGAAISLAAVKLTSQDQGTVRTIQSNPSGVYQFSFLPAGTYNIDVSATGFKSLRVPGIVLAVAQAERRDLQLEVGTVSQSVTVSGAVDLIDTDNATTGAVIENRKVVAMPLNGRQFYSLASLTPGVMLAAQNSTNSTRGGFNVMGACDVCNNYQLNGVFNNNVALGGIPGVRPSIDSIQEFNVLTGIYSAQHGYNAGGQIVVITKSGTNALHGDAFEFIRNQVANARNYFAAPGPLPVFRSNQFGGTIGGPIQKDKTFFFFSYEGLRFDQAITALATYPTLAMQGGDFSGISNVITDPSTGLPFQNNKIPTDRISPIGAALAALYPGPNVTTAPGALPSNNYNFQQPRIETYNSFSLKVDHTFNERDSAFASANYYNDASTETGATLTAGCVPYYLPEFTCGSHQKSQIYSIGETHVFSASLVNQVHIGLYMQATESYPTTAYHDFWGAYGIHPLISPTAATTRVPTFGYPSTTITGFTNFASSDINYYHIPTWDLNDTLSWTRGKHTITMGVDLIHAGANSINLGSPAGTLTFTNSSTGPTSGYGFADLLLGLPATSASSPYKYEFYSRSASPSVFVQDDFKVTSNLTLNLGLRWETNTPIIDPANNLTSFDPKTGLPAVQANPAPVPAATAVPYETLKTRSLWNSDFRDFSPRIGFAWQPLGDGKTVIRGGFGTFYNNSTNLLNSVLDFPGGVPYTISNTFTSSQSQALQLSNPFPSSGAVTSSTLYGVDPNYQNPRSYVWTLGGQRAVAKDVLVELAYVGTVGRHLIGTTNINQPAPGPGTPAEVNARRPYPNFGTITYTRWGFSSSFNDLQLKVTKNYGYGVSLLGSYVYSHSIDTLGTPTDAYNLSTATGSSNFDVRHRIVVSAVWDLPFGPGKELVTNGVISHVVAGWELSPLVQWQTGIPLTATLSGNFSNSGGTTDRPNVISNPNSGAPHTVQEWFNTAAFEVPIASGQPGAPYSFGNEGRNIILGPGLVNTDLQLSRTFGFGDRLKAQFRGEFFDLMNHPNFGLPNLVANGGPSFGTITSTVTAQNESGGANRTIQLGLKLTF